MKILITGGNGNIAAYMKYYFSKDQVYCLGKRSLNVTDKEHAFDIISSVQPDVVINLAAITNIKLCESDPTSAYLVNVVGTMNIALACNMRNIPVVYISTNNVFDGCSNKAYHEYDACNPVNCYGKTKLASESLLRTLCTKYYIIRTSWIFGSFKCIINNAFDHKGIIFLPDYEEIANLTYIEDLCNFIKAIIKSNNYGIFNFTNLGEVSKENWIKKSYSLMNLPLQINHFSCDSSYPPIPRFAALDCSLLFDIFNIKPISWEERLESYIKKEKNR